MIQLNSILNIKDEDLCKYKLHLAVSNGKEQPLDVFARSFTEWQGWNEWRGNKNDFTREYIFSIISDYTRPGIFIFGGIFQILERLDDYEETEIGYHVELTDQFKELIGRLVIDFDKPYGLRGRAFYFEKYIYEMSVSEITEKPYGGIPFPGYENVILPFRMLETLVNNHKQDWSVSLSNIKGIYMIIDKSNGKKYIGSAYGDAGLWSRFTCYAQTAHGYNDGLVELITEKGIDYARENFQVSILETLNMNSSDDFVIVRENFWKDALLSRGEFGYNRN